MARMEAPSQSDWNSLPRIDGRVQKTEQMSMFRELGTRLYDAVAASMAPGTT